MYAYIKGKIASLQPATIVLDNQGVGYLLHISLNTYTQIQNQEEVKLHTYFHVKEDGQSLWGFADEKERDLFMLLISVSGIGPNTARMMLSSVTPEEISHAILQENVAQIQAVKGIGPKTAKRLILELKDKVTRLATNDTQSPSLHTSIATRSVQQEAVGALVALGFAKNGAEAIVQKILKEKPDLNVENTIKQALRSL